MGAWSRAVLWWIALALGCGRSEPLPASVLDMSDDGYTASGGALRGGAGGTLRGGADGASGAAQSAGAGNGGHAGAAGGGRAGAGSSGQPGFGGGAGSRPLPDRCVVPGPPPAVGRADGSDYHLGTPTTFLDIFPTYQYLSLGDVDGDGRPDLLASKDDDLHLFFATGPATLGELLPIESGLTVGGFRGGAHFARVDADDRLDIVVGHEQGMSVVWNDGSGGFPRFELTAGPPTTDPVVVDIDSDGDLDIVGLRSDFTTAVDDVVLAYLNEGNGEFVLREIGLGTHLYDLHVADVTGDGLADLLVANGPEPLIRVHAQDASGDFRLAEELTAGDGPAFALWFGTGDFDHDGLLDLVAIQDEDVPDVEHVWIAYQRSGALEPLHAVIEIPKDGGNIAGGDVRVTDLNLDGFADIAFPSSAFDMVVVLTRPDGTFREVHTAFPTAGSVHDDAIAIADVNCDGCPDLLGAQVGQLVLFPGVACAH